MTRRTPRCLACPSGWMTAPFAEIGNRFGVDPGGEKHRKLSLTYFIEEPFRQPGGEASWHLETQVLEREMQTKV